MAQAHADVSLALNRWPAILSTLFKGVAHCPDKYAQSQIFAMRMVDLLCAWSHKFAVQNAGELNPHHKFLVHNKTTLTTDGKLMICNYNATTSTPPSVHDANANIFGCGTILKYPAAISSTLCLY